MNEYLENRQVVNFSLFQGTYLIQYDSFLSSERGIVHYFAGKGRERQEMGRIPDAVR
jgi:hypothetical protein